MAIGGKRLEGEWIGVDLDGTLAEWTTWRSVGDIGPPVPRMLERVRAWLAEGREVKIFTARVARDEFTCLVDGKTWTRGEVVAAVQQWLVDQGLPPLDVTATKDFLMVELWDDRCVQVIPNTGRTLAEEHEAAIEIGREAIDIGLRALREGEVK